MRRAISSLLSKPRWLVGLVVAAVVLLGGVFIGGGLVTRATNDFPDVSPGAFYHDSVTFLKANGITAGFPDGTYRPNNAVTRGEMAVFLQRLAGQGAAPSVNADKLDGIDSTGFASSTHNHDAVPPGETVYGTMGARYDNVRVGSEVASTASLPMPAPVGLTDPDVTVAGVDDPTGACTGTSSNPTAPPGFVCMYPWFTLNATVNGGFMWGAGDGDKWGFQISWDATAAGATTFFANWAYTAPL